MKLGTRCIALTISLLAVDAAFAAEQRNYLILVDGGKKAGEHTAQYQDNGTVTTKFIFKDNGRGPEVQEKFRLQADGSLASYQATGSTTFGSAINERYSYKNGLASWQSTSEKGSQKLASTALYSPINGSPELTSVALALLAKSANGELAMLPGGTLKQTLIDTLSVQSSEGESREVQLLKLTGQGLAPNFVWASRGAGNQGEIRLFANVVPGYMLIVPPGWENVGKELEQRQRAAEQKVLQEFAQQALQKQTGLTLIKNARVFDSVNAKLGALSDVYLLRGKITAVLPSGSPAQSPDHVVDAAGRVLLPGLFDMHGHVSQWDGALNLAAGVTTVRDMGNDNATLQRLMDDHEHGQLLMTQIVPAGFLEGESAFSARNGFVVSNLEQAKNAIDWYQQHGYPQLKIYNSFPKQILQDTIAYAHQRGLRVSGHIPVFLRAEDAVNAGYDEIQHINQVLLNFLVKPDTDTRTLERFYLPAKKVADMDFNAPQVQQFIKLLKDKQVTIDPTLSTFEFLRQRDGEVASSYAPIVEHMPLEVQRQLRSGGGIEIPDQKTYERFNRSYEKMIEFVGLMYKAGIPIVAGTDAVAGFTLHAELELYVRAGLSPSQALQVATINGAKYSRLANSRGQIAAGFDADLVLVDGDPTQQISDVRKVVLVFTQGGVVNPSRIYEMMGIKPFVSNLPKITSVAPSQQAISHGLQLHGAHR